MHHSKKLALQSLTVLMLGACALACDSSNSKTERSGPEQAEGAESKGAESKSAESKSAEPGEKAGPKAAADQPAAAAKGPVEVAKTGTEFDPPVKKSQIPDGAWMCDMGTVHYARLEEGDGKCPVCKMKLVKKGHADPEGSGGGGHQH